MSAYSFSLVKTKDEARCDKRFLPINKLDFGENEVVFFKIFQKFKLIVESLNRCNEPIPYEVEQNGDDVVLVFSEKSLQSLFCSVDKYNNLFKIQHKEITELANNLLEIAGSATERPDICMREDSVNILGEMFVLNTFSIKHVFMFPYISYFRFNMSKYKDLLGGLTETFDIDLSKGVVSDNKLGMLEKTTSSLNLFLQNLKMFRDFDQGTFYKEFLDPKQKSVFYDSVWLFFYRNISAMNHVIMHFDKEKINEKYKLLIDGVKLIETFPEIQIRDFFFAQRIDLGLTIIETLGQLGGKPIGLSKHPEREWFEQLRFSVKSTTEEQRVESVYAKFLYLDRTKESQVKAGHIAQASLKLSQTSKVTVYDYDCNVILLQLNTAELSKILHDFNTTSSLKFKTKLICQSTDLSEQYLERVIKVSECFSILEPNIRSINDLFTSYFLLIPLLNSSFHHIPRNEDNNKILFKISKLFIDISDILNTNIGKLNFPFNIVVSGVTHELDRAKIELMLSSNKTFFQDEVKALQSRFPLFKLSEEEVAKQQIRYETLLREETEAYDKRIAAQEEELEVEKLLKAVEKEAARLEAEKQKLYFETMKLVPIQRAEEIDENIDDFYNAFNVGIYYIQRKEYSLAQSYFKRAYASCELQDLKEGPLPAELLKLPLALIKDSYSISAFDRTILLINLIECERLTQDSWSIISVDVSDSIDRASTYLSEMNEWLAKLSTEREQKLIYENISFFHDLIKIAKTSYEARFEKYSQELTESKESYQRFLLKHPNYSHCRKPKDKQDSRSQRRAQLRELLKLKPVFLQKVEKFQVELSTSISSFDASSMKPEVKRALKPDKKKKKKKKK